MADPINNQGAELKIPKKIVRTYSSDLAKSVQEKGGEAYRIARVEQGIKERDAKIEAKKGKSNLIFGLGGLAFIVLAFGALVYFSSKSNVKLNPEPAPGARPIIFYDKQSQIDITGLDQGKILAAFKKETDESKLGTNEVANIVFAENNLPVSLTKLLALLKIVPPKEMTPFLSRDYFVGLFADTGLSTEQSGKNWPFIILRTSSYADISPAIILWEDHMLDDLGPILGIDVSGNNNYLLQSKFTNTIVSNKETKAIKDKEGNIVLMYLFLDETDILIARNKNTLDEVLLRLYSPKK
jgi:hypothetical protein